MTEAGLWVSRDLLTWQAVTRRLLAIEEPLDHEPGERRVLTMATVNGDVIDDHNNFVGLELVTRYPWVLGALSEQGSHGGAPP